MNKASCLLDLSMLRKLDVEVQRIEGDIDKYNQKKRKYTWLYIGCIMFSILWLCLGFQVSISTDNTWLGAIVASVPALVALSFTTLYERNVNKLFPVLTVKNLHLSNAALLYIGEHYHFLSENSEAGTLVITPKRRQE